MQIYYVHIYIVVLSMNMLKILLSVNVEFILSIPIGVIVVYFSYLVSGLSKEKFYNTASCLSVEVVYFTALLLPILQTRGMKDRIQNYFVKYLLFYSVASMFGIASFFAQLNAFQLIFQVSFNEACSFITYHSIVAFLVFVVTSQFPGYFQKLCLGKVLCNYCSSWGVFYLLIGQIYDKQVGNNLLGIQNFNLFCGFSVSAILANLLFDSVFKYLFLELKYREIAAVKSCVVLAFSVLQFAVICCISKFAYRQSTISMSQLYQCSWSVLTFTWWGHVAIGGHFNHYRKDKLLGKFYQRLLMLSFLLMLGYVYTLFLWFLYFKFIDPVFAVKLIGAPTTNFDFQKPGVLFSYAVANVSYLFHYLRSMKDEEAGIKKDQADLEEAIII